MWDSGIGVGEPRNGLRAIGHREKKRLIEVSFRQFFNFNA
jgi:hypothetical protein